MVLFSIDPLASDTDLSAIDRQRLGVLAFLVARISLGLRLSFNLPQLHALS